MPTTTLPNGYTVSHALSAGGFDSRDPDLVEKQNIAAIAHALDQAVLPAADAVIRRANRTLYRFNASADTDAARGTALAAAFAALTAGDDLWIGPGNFQMSAGVLVPSSTRIWGCGYASNMYLASGLNSAIDMIKNVDTTNGNSNIVIRDIRLDGNNTGNTSAAQNGITLVKCTNCIIENNFIEHLGRAETGSCIGIKPNACTDLIIRGNVMTDVVDGINPTTATTLNMRLTITGNVVNSTNRDYAINLFKISHSTIANNVLRSLLSAINCQTDCVDNTISGNVVYSSTSGNGIFITTGAARNTIIGNKVRGCGGDGGIVLSGPAGNNNQIVFNDVYGAHASADLVVDGTPTGTITFGNKQSNTSVGAAPAF